MSKCNHDCFNCPYSDCIAPEDDITLRDQGVTNSIERYAQDNLGLTAAQRAQRKYEKSEKGKAASKRYRTSEKGKSTNRRAVSSYYQRNKEKNRQAARDYYAKHAEKIKERMREYRRRKKEQEEPKK